jgi:F-type H+-transporting ATPase subunit b
VNFNLTLLGQAISLALFVWFCMRFIWPHLTNALGERQKRVADGLAAAEQGRKQLDEAQVKYEELVEEGKQQAATIISQAQKRGGEIVEEAKNTAKVEHDRIVEAGKHEVAQEKELAREELRSRVATLALAGAEQVLMREVDKKAHNEVLSKISAGL